MMKLRKAITAAENGTDVFAIRRQVVGFTQQFTNHLLAKNGDDIDGPKVAECVIGMLGDWDSTVDWEANRSSIERIVGDFLFYATDPEAFDILSQTRREVLELKEASGELPPF